MNRVKEINVNLASIAILFNEEIVNILHLHQLPDFKARYIGKNGLVTNIFKDIAKLDIEEKKIIGAEINQLKQKLEKAIANKFQFLEIEEINQYLKITSCDISIPVDGFHLGKLHPVSKTIDDIYGIFKNLGFDLRFDREIETSFYNFDALNFGKMHPARSMHDSFFTDLKSPLVNEFCMLRTHTSSVQIRAMLNNKPPFCFLSPGRTYRCDFDRTHTPMFTQVEGVLVDKNISFANLKWVVESFLKQFFQESALGGVSFDVRFRPSFFPFTEPSAEVDIGVRQKDGSIKYLEVLGCGLIHKNVLQSCNVDSEVYSGLSFGLGVERFAMLKYQINDLRDFFENKAWWTYYYGI